MFVLFFIFYFGLVLEDGFFLGMFFVMIMLINGGLFLGYSFCEGVGNVFGEDDIFEIIIGVIKCFVGVSGILV